MSWLKRFFGSSDAVRQARAEMGGEDGTPGHRPAGWGDPDIRDEQDEVVIAMTAPGLHGDTVAVQPEGSKLNVRASGQGARGERLVLEEFLNFPEGSDLSGASAAYENDQVLIRVPKSGLKHSAG